MVKKLFFILSFLVSFTCLSSQSWALPPCPSSPPFDNCYRSYTFPNGEKYLGEWQNSKKHGQGTYNHLNGDKYIGEYKNDMMGGQGTYTWKKSGNKYIGEWENNKQHGQGIKTYTDGRIEEGIWKHNKFMYNKKLTSKLTSKSTSKSNNKIEEYKSFCSDIGFIPGTEKFGECVLKAMEKD